MKTIKTFLTNRLIIVYLSLFCIAQGCQEFLEVDDPLGEIKHEIIFNDEISATTAVTTLYSKLRDNVIINGSLYGNTILMGLYADELDYYGSPGIDLEFFYTHQVLPENGVISNVWNSSYNLIYLCNSIIESLQNSTNISEPLRDQLYGETIFVRSLVYFYLINLFGDIPYTTQTNYEINKNLHRTDKIQIYNSIIADLSDAHSKLSPEYVSAEKVRANRYVVSALLSRIYLYTENWESAILYSTEVINQENLYSLEPDTSKEFLKESSSTIFQLKPQHPGMATSEAGNFIFDGPPAMLALSAITANSFEPGDKRREDWVKETTDGTQVWYMSNKYKRFDLTNSPEEYSIIFRLAEQYLIRAEARLKMGEFMAAAEDINHIRFRSGLPNVTASQDLNSIIIKERRSELFCEHGHRWFDLKRWNIAAQVLSPIKTNWTETDVLLPLPISELLLNPNLYPQNPGY